MGNNNYVRVGDIIEQERLKRQAQIAKGVNSDVYDHIEKAHKDDLSKGVEMTDNLSRFADDVDNLSKAETELLLSKLQRQIVADPESSLLKSFKSIALNHLDDIEKAVYADNAQNRKLGRVGQEYGGKGSRGGKTDEENAGRIKGKKKEQQKAQKITADDAAKFLSENASKWMEYQYDSLDDEELAEKFDKIEKFVKFGKQFDWNEKEDAEEYARKMESKGYHCIDIGEGSSTIAYALIKKNGVKKAEDDDGIEKAVYADTAENRKLGRVGQEYGGVGSRGGKGKTPQERQTAKSKNGSKNTKEVYDEDFNDDLKYFLDNFGPFGAPKEAEGVKVGSVNDKGEIWVPNHNKTKDGGYEGQWMSKNEIEDRANRHRAYNGDSKLTSEQKKAWPIGTKYTDKKGREFTIVKHDSNKGRIKLVHKTDDGKKKSCVLSGYNLKTGLHPNFTTGFPEIDKKLREVYDKAH